MRDYAVRGLPFAARAVTPTDGRSQAIRELTDHLLAGGYRGCVIGIDGVQELGREIDKLRRSGGIAEKLYEDYLSGFVFEPPADLPGAKSVILVSTPSPQVRTYFTIKGKRLPAIIPPTYADWDVSREAMGVYLSAFLGRHGYSLRRAYLPEKLLATRCGLARYGKNNITYIPETGSFHRPAAFYSDLPGPAALLGEPQMLDLCRNCTACLRACPTGAISQDRFLLRAERCVTFLNENPGEFPDWWDPAWQECLIGCMRCQLACPADRAVWEWIEDSEGFDEEETSLILEGVDLGSLPRQTQAKLKRLRLDHHLDVLPRNLAVLISRMQ